MSDVVRVLLPFDVVCWPPDTIRDGTTASPLDTRMIPHMVRLQQDPTGPDGVLSRTDSGFISLLLSLR